MACERELAGHFLALCYWTDGLNAMNADPEVMRYLTGRPETREETLAAIERVKARWAEWGFSWWSFIAKESDEIVGAGCIQYLGGNPANPLEIGWRVRRDKWRQGLPSRPRSGW